MTDRVEKLRAYHAAEVLGCVRCPLHRGRTQVVAGSGNPEAGIMFVGEAPGFHEDRQGVPFVGAAGKLLATLLGGIGLTREDVFIANVLKCRPPENRDPLPSEIEQCKPHLFRQIEIIGPALVCTLGNFATKLISGRDDGISRVHGHELPLRISDRDLLLYPLFHPAAALYQRSTLALLEEDFARIPALCASASRAQPAAAPPPPAPPPPAVSEPPAQLGLF